MTQIKWLAWGETALTKAKSENKPLFLYLRSTWCQDCDAIEQTVFLDPGIAAIIDERFVAVKADSDRRPDLYARYGMGSWPSIAFLSARGRVLAGETHMSTESFRATLDEVSRSYQQNHKTSESDSSAGMRLFPEPSTSAGELAWTFVEDTLEALEDDYDGRYGGFKRTPKLPRAESLLLALTATQWGYEDKQRLAVHTLKSMNAGQIHDRIEDGFFRFASARDWSRPHHGKTLDLNARLLQCYLSGYGLSGTREFLTVAREIAEFMLDVLWLPDETLFGGSQHADPEYFAADAADRRKLRPPIVDKALFSGPNALAAMGLLSMWWVTDNEQYLVVARRVQETLAQLALKSSGAVIHSIDGVKDARIEGYLQDQAFMSMLMVEIYQATGDKRDLELLDRILGYCEKNLIAPGGALYDLAPANCDNLGIPLLVPPTDNALMAQAYVMAWGVTGDDSHLDRARSIVEGVLPEHEPGVDDSSVALAAGCVLRPVAVETGSRLADLAQFTKAKVIPGMAVRYDRLLENTAIVHTPGESRARVATWRDLERDLALTLNPRGLFVRERAGRYFESPRPY